jgi:DNA-binding CsgD family transcriptional regulator
MDQTDPLRFVEALLDRLPIGVIALSPAGAILRTNAAADAILRERDGLERHRDLLRGGRAAMTTVLRAAIAAGCGAVLLPRSAGRAPLAAVVAPLGPAAPGGLALFIMDPDAPLRTPLALLRNLFGLTPAEARLALILGEGDTVKEAAEALGVSVSTIRYQLRQIFAKTKTDRQPALMRLLLLLGLLPIPAAGDPNGPPPGPRKKAG